MLRRSIVDIYIMGSIVGVYSVDLWWGSIVGGLYWGSIVRYIVGVYNGVYSGGSTI